jgi:DNA-binding NtrC family response regulator
MLNPLKRILVVDDEKSMTELLGIMLRREGYEVLAAGSRSSAADLLARNHVDMVITDVKLPDGDGTEILRHVKAASPETAVIMMTAYGSTQAAVGAMKLGAHDYLIKPFDVDELKIVVRSAFDRQRLSEQNALLKVEFQTRHGLDRIVGSSPAMATLFNLIRSVAPTNSTVMISGESGTGKELVAKAMHALSRRKEEAFVSINCGALPESLLESELFGHVKGAFTDAYQNKKGLFEAAHRGTLFLDEVGETPLSMQVKLLRALQERRIRRVGGTSETEVDVRVIGASNRSLEELVKAGHFRSDLYYRLNVIPIRLPPLRERKEDVALLAGSFLARFTQSMGKRIQGISSPALERLSGYHWPGNVRELENVMERAVALETGDEIQAHSLPEWASAAKPLAAPTLGEGFSIERHLAGIESDLVEHALAQAGGDRAGAARLLGVTPRSLRYLLSKRQE